MSNKVIQLRVFCVCLPISQYYNNVILQHYNTVILQYYSTVIRRPLGVRRRVRMCGPLCVPPPGPKNLPHGGGGPPNERINLPQYPPKTHPKIYQISILILDLFLRPKWPQHRPKINRKCIRNSIQKPRSLFYRILIRNGSSKPCKTYVFLKENKDFRGSALFASILIFVHKNSQNQLQNRSKINQLLDQKHI